MASNLDFTLRRNNGTDTDVLYPTTRWSQVEEKPSTYTPTAHTHGNITNAGAIGSTANLVAVTTTDGVLTTASRSGIDSRSTFPPASHTHDDRYYTESEITTLLSGKAASSHTHGNITNAGAIGSTANLVIMTGASGVLGAKAAGTTSQYLRGDGTWGTPPNTTYSAMTVSDGQTGSSTASSLMRADYLKSITEYRVNNMGIVNLNGGTLGGLSFTQNHTVSVPSGGYKWVKLFTVSNLSAGKVTMTLGGTTTQQSMTIDFKNSHYTEACGLIVSTQSYNPIVSKVAIYGDNGGDKSLYIYVDAISYSRSITYNVHDLLGTLLSIDNSVLAGAPSGTASIPVDLPYEGNITVTNGAFYATATNVWGTLSHRVSASIEPAKSEGFKRTFIYTGTITRTIRIPANSAQEFPIGTEFVIINYNTGSTAFAPDGGVTLNGSSVFPTYTTRYKPLRLIKVDTDAWVGEYSA